MIVIITGMHRSGTSALAGLLHSNNIVMGEDENFYPPPMKENPKGFFENVRFRRLNDFILKGYGYKVKSFKTDIPLVFSIDLNTEKKMVDLILEYHNKYDYWGWKDPRNSLTLYVWLEVLSRMQLLNEVKIITMHRSFTEIYESMVARGNKEIEANQFVDLALQYLNRNRLYLHYFREVSSIEIQFSDLIEITSGVALRLNEFLGISKIVNISFIDKKLKRN